MDAKSQGSIKACAICGVVMLLVAVALRFVINRHATPADTDGLDDSETVVESSVPAAEPSPASEPSDDSGRAGEPSPSAEPAEPIGPGRALAPSPADAPVASPEELARLEAERREREEAERVRLEREAAKAAYLKRLDNRKTVLVKPIEQWTEAERAEYPAIADWLESRSRQVLPWEWSEQAKTKDLSGYCRLWYSLAEELDREIAATAKRLAKEEKSLVDRLEETEVYLDDAKARALKLNECAAATNFPFAVTVTEKKPGFFFGWNDREKTISFISAQDVESCIAEECERVTSLAARRHELKQRLESNASALKTVESQRKMAESLVGWCSTAVTFAEGGEVDGTAAQVYRSSVSAIETFAALIDGYGLVKEYLSRMDSVD